MQTAPETAAEMLDVAGRRKLIEAELRRDPQRSDRKIAEAVGQGVCHKTVGAARERLGIASLGNSPSAPTAPELPADDDMVNMEFPHGNVLMRRDQADAVQAALDQVAGHLARDRKARLKEADVVGEKNEERTILPRRHEVTIQHDTENGTWILKQRNWPDDDDVIVLSDEDIHEFVDVLTDHLGYGRAP